MRIDISDLDDACGFWQALIKGESIWYDDICMGIRYALWGKYVYIIAFDCSIGEIYFLKIPEEKLRLPDIEEDPDKYLEEFHRRMREIFDKATDIILREPENPDNTLDKAILEVVEKI